MVVVWNDLAKATEGDLVVPAEFMSHQRMNDFLDFVVHELGQRSAGGCYSLGPLGRLRTIHRSASVLRAASRRT